MSINKIKQTYKFKLTLLADGSVVYNKIFSYKKLNRFEADSSNVLLKK